MQNLEGAGAPLVKKENGLLRAICSRCEEELKTTGKDLHKDVESNDLFKEKKSDMTHNCYRCDKHLD